MRSSGAASRGELAETEAEGLGAAMISRRAFVSFGKRGEEIEGEKQPTGPACIRMNSLEFGPGRNRDGNTARWF